ncbi:hypothetical protein Hanom_Chr05g00427491 [Helianthus anomalus]
MNRIPSSIRLIPCSCASRLSSITCLTPTNCSSTYPCKSSNPVSILSYKDSNAVAELEEIFRGIPKVFTIHL